MASSTLPALCFFLAALSCLAVSPRADGVRSNTHRSVIIQSLLPKKTCSSLNKDHGWTNATMLNLFHKHGPCLPLSHDNQILGAADVQARTGTLFSWHGRMTTRIPTILGSPFRTSDYVVTLGFGSPQVKTQALIIDTGSDLTWIQCRPCSLHCYNQRDQIYDPSHSASYSNIPCSSNYCRNPDIGEVGLCNAGGDCLYKVEYGDGSLTTGLFAQERLTVTPGGGDVIPDFRFGCGEYNDITSDARTAGILGLGRGEVSFISQTFKKYGGVFSYCLPATSSSTGYLTLGGSPPSDVQFVPMLADEQSNYVLSLIGISVGGHKLSVPPEVFSGGILIDSGSDITLLPPRAYSALRSAIRKLMSGYERSAPEDELFDTCYVHDFRAGTGIFLIPAVSLEFDGGVTVDLHPSGILIRVAESKICLAFAANSVSILGSVQQRTMNVVFDLSRKLIGFGPLGSC